MPAAARVTVARSMFPAVKAAADRASNPMTEQTPFQARVLTGWAAAVAAAFAGGERGRMKDELDEAMNDLARLKRDIHVRLMAEKAEKADKDVEVSAG